MSGLEIFQNGTSLHPDRMGEPVYQIGRKNADGEYDVVVFDGMSKQEAEARLVEMQPKPPKAKPAAKPAAKPVEKKKQVSKPAPKKAKAKAKTKLFGRR
tara:strand:- start:446 stop:742 length:297 start_codon:yes stop_codon:yes gene_type:complete